MNKEFSIYLDLGRFIAACIVVLEHIHYYGVISGSSAEFLPDSLARDAVIYFFILSGFVVSYTTEANNHSVKGYLIARLTRIYSVAFPVLLLTVCVDLIGIYFNPSSYSGLYQYEKLYVYIPFHLFFLGEIWTLSEQPFTLTPYWSLGYEVWYYIAFIPLYFYRGIKRVVYFSLIFLFIGYKLWLLFPIWISGFLLYRYYDKVKISIITARILFLFSLFSFFIYKYFGVDSYLNVLGSTIWPFDGFNLSSAKKYLSDYVVCIFVLLNIYSAYYCKFSSLINYNKIIVGLSSYTFTLYLIHSPILKTIKNN